MELEHGCHKYQIVVDKSDQVTWVFKFLHEVTMLIIAVLA